MLKLISIILILGVTSAEAFVIDTSKNDQKITNGCAASVSTGVSNEPKNIDEFNNLTRLEDQFSDKLSAKIILFGRVRDKNCVAIANAEIDIWQSDEYGVYRYIKNRATYNQMYSKFKGVGSAISNNQGEFSFVTLYPKKLDSINLVAKYKDFPELKTKITLLESEEISKNASNVLARNLNGASIKGYKVYYFDIVLDGKQKYLGY